MIQADEQLIRDVVQRVVEQVRTGWGGRVPPRPGASAPPPITSAAAVPAGSPTRRFGQFCDVDEAVAAGAEPKRVVNLLLGRGAAIANERGCAIAEVGVSAEQLAGLARMLAEGKVNATAAERIFEKMAAEGGEPEAIAEAEGLLAVSDAGQIAAWVDRAIAENPQAVADVKAGGKKQKKAFGFLMGQVMRLSGGAAVPAEVQKLLRERLGQ